MEVGYNHLVLTIIKEGNRLVGRNLMDIIILVNHLEVVDSISLMVVDTGLEEDINLREEGMSLEEVLNHSVGIDLEEVGINLKVGDIILREVENLVVVGISLKVVA